jgi:colanic acid/amylovoran biosynthesis glycosyltransferase
MRIAMVVPTFPQLSETFIVTKALGLVDRGLDVHVVCGSSPEANWEAFGVDHRVQELRPRVHVAPTKSVRPAALNRSTQQVARLAGASRGTLRRYFAADQGPVARRVRDVVLDAPLIELTPDVVHFEFGALAVDRMSIGDRLDAAVTVSFRGFDLNYAGLDHPDHYRRVWEHADGVHVLGEDLWRRAVHRGAPPDLPHSLIPPAIDAAGIEASEPRGGVLGTSAAPLHILSVGRLHWKKGYDYALEAVAELRRAGLSVRYRVIGDGDMLGAVAFWRHQLGLDDVVELLGAVSPAEVHRQIGWADTFLHAATSEGFCNAVIEAQAHQVPVVCSDADGLSENVDDGVTGIVVPRRDAHALADGLSTLAADPDLRHRMGLAGRERALRLFGLDQHLDRWVRFYQDAVEHHAVAAGKG